MGMMYLRSGGNWKVEFLVKDGRDFERFVPAGSVESEIRKKVPREFLYFDLLVTGRG
jgi:hypothetical protein